MFCGAKYTHHTFTPIIKHLIITTANKHPGKKSFIDKHTHTQKQPVIHFDCKFIWYKAAYNLSKIHLEHSINLLLAALSSQTCDGVKPIFNCNCYIPVDPYGLPV